MPRRSWMQGIFSTSEVAWLPFSLILVFSITTWAQNTGRMHGTVKDPTGASIPAAQIAVTNPATGLVRNASTDSAGAFVVLSLPIGAYNVEVKAQGFTTTNVKDLVLHIGEDLLVDVTMRVCETESFSVDESWLSRQPLRTSPTSERELRQRVATEEKQAIEAALMECRGRVFGPSGAAAKLGIARSTLDSKIKTLKIDKNRFKVSNPS